MVQTLSQLQGVLQSVTSTITELDGKKVRIAFQAQGQPARLINEDIIYLSIRQADNPYDKQRDFIYNADYERMDIYYTRVMECQWYCYGPNSFDYADEIRNGILLDDIRNVLRLEDVFPITGIASPDRVPYLFDGQWWERSDLRVLMNVLTLRTSTTPFFEGAEVLLYDEEGLQRTATIE